MDTNDVIRISQMGQTHLFALLDRISRACVDSAKTCLSLHVIGLADLDGAIRQDMIKGIPLLAEFERQLQDKELINNVALLRQNLQGIVSLDENIISMYTKLYFSKAIGKRKLKSQVYKSRVDGEEIPESILSVASETDKLVGKIVEIQKNIDARIHQLAP